MPIFRAIPETFGAHVHVRLFVGPEGCGKLAGTLVLRPEEAAAFDALLAAYPLDARILGPNDYACPVPRADAHMGATGGE